MSKILRFPALALAALVLAGASVQAQTPTTVLTTQPTLAEIDAKLNEILTRLGTPPGRSGVSDQIERQNAEMKQLLKDLGNEVRDIQNELKRMKR